MNISVQNKENNISVIKLFGQFYVDEESKLVDTIDRLLNSGRADFVINLNGLTSINSQGLAIIIAAKKKIKEAGGELKISEARPFIKELFELTRLHTIFEMFNLTEDAVSSFSK